MSDRRPRTPALAVDLVIRHAAEPGRILVIERHNPPHGWALPGGFVDVGESAEHAAVREAREETGLQVELQALLGVYSAPDRDPRGHTVSVVYLAQGNGQARAADDARDCAWLDPGDPGLPLAFDHRRIVDDYLRYRLTGEVAPLRTRTD
ncbi:NUDIX domain-containing protein [Thioalkalivibrio halophilus]|uniref:NUDIX hydrolase n=1 Tax=Thioalkalivibrio halophilus TaxID=252474 RepID=A0A1V2ZZ93_9GAMM|nr:NUDIX hydrolase [Thioalkalivibrio halophilus]OOC10401.1 NUDIX hydrolase [Thioalkalivibrio halophilus]